MNFAETIPVEMQPNPETKEAVAERLEIARIALGFQTQQAFAATIDVSAAKWNNYVAGRDRISLNVALELCKKHRLSLDWIYRADPTGLPLALARRIDEVSARIERSPTQPHRRKLPEDSKQPRQQR
jgi:DNA-binding XRE family transcriptional regulator